MYVFKKQLYLNVFSFEGSKAELAIKLSMNLKKRGILQGT